MIRCSNLVLVAVALSLLYSGPSAAQTASSGGDAFFSLQGENASISSGSITDRYYTNALRIGYTSPEDAYTVLHRLTDPVFGEGHVRLEVDLTQQIYTPLATQLSAAPKGDEPYAGVLLANFAAVQEDANSLSSIGLSVGLVGPSALGEDVQNGFHDLIGQGRNLGWRSQLRNEPVFGVSVGRIWRQSLANLGGLETDVLPMVDVTAGTLRSAAEAGFTLRIGRSLQNDFGATRIRSVAGGDIFHPGDVVGWYIFAGAKGQLVANDITLNGNTFVSSMSVPIVPVVGEVDFGAALMGDGFRVTIADSVQTQTFRHQKGGAHQMGSLGLSVLF